MDRSFRRSRGRIRRRSPSRAGRRLHRGHRAGPSVRPGRLVEEEGAQVVVGPLFAEHGTGGARLRAPTSRDHVPDTAERRAGADAGRIPHPTLFASRPTMRRTRPASGRTPTTSSAGVARRSSPMTARTAGGCRRLRRGVLCGRRPHRQASLDSVPLHPDGKCAAQHSELSRRHRPGRRGLARPAIRN